MKKLILLCFFSAAVLTASAQSLIFALQSVGGPNGFSNFAVIDPLTGLVSDLQVLEEVQAISFASSTLDQLQGKYIFSGIDQTNQARTFFHDAYTGDTESELLEIPFLNGMQYDMLTGGFFGLGYQVVDSVLNPSGTSYEYIYSTVFIEVDVQTGDQVFSQPVSEVEAMVVGTTTMDAINGYYYFIGIRQSDASTALFGIDIETGMIAFNVSMNMEANEYLNDLEYDMLTGQFYALHRHQGNMHFASLDPLSGEITDLLDLTTEVQYFTPDASVYHQETGRFIMLTLSNEGNGILTLDANNASIIAHPIVDYSLIEMEVDNIDFAFSLASATTGIPEFEENSLILYPNPAQDFIRLELPNHQAFQAYVIHDIKGKQVAQGRVIDNQVIPLNQHLSNGAFYITVFNTEKSATGSFQILR